MKRICPKCEKIYETELERPSGDNRAIQKIFPDAEPYQREQLQVGYCSDKCNDEAISGERPEYTYDEKGRRFENGERKLFADPPREDDEDEDEYEKHDMRSMSDVNQSVEDTVIQYLEGLYKKRRGDTTDEELNDTDLEWELDHINHTVGYVEDEKRAKKLQYP